MTVYNRNELAQKVGIAASTVSKWSKEFNIQIRKAGGMSRYSEDVLQVFETIKQLKDERRTDETIRRVIDPVMTRHDLPYIGHDADMTGHDNQKLNHDLSSQVTTAVIQALEDNNELAEKYAKATYTIGALERDKVHLENKIHELQNQIKLLPEPVECQLLQKDKDYLSQENSDLKQELESQTKKLNELKNHWLAKILLKKIL